MGRSHRSTGHVQLPLRVPNMTGYWTQDGMAIGALQAVMAANPAVWPQGVGEGRCQYLKLWQEALTLNPNFDTIAVANHPGVSPTGLAHCC